MPFPAAQCFVVEQVNRRAVTVFGQPCGEHPYGGCYRSDDRTEVVFDVARVDTGQVIAAEVTWMRQVREPGAMYWDDARQDHYPTGPDDWTGYSDDSLDRLRRSYAEHPDWYGGPYQPDPDTRPGRLAGLPRRSPSHLFGDGPQLMVVCPNGTHWNIDSRASNCSRPYDYTHRCWVRVGDPPGVHVTKDGDTCQAGGGSIMAYGPRDVGDYHGFLHHGVLTAG